ncbi:MAG: N-acetylmuramoyl-L-alanine amidase [Candidatus Omnitrophica bacterium]|nr:N-acetylmuramoyl-L-alanine amidase [Candidatus Omnitrophota bacterium]
MPRKPCLPEVKGKFIELTEFCKKYRLKYNFDTIDDILYIKSSSKDIKLLLETSFMYFNGRIFSLSQPPFYSQGKIFIPKDIEDIVGERYKRELGKPYFFINTIVIDPGHGGKDPGAISKTGVKEKDLNLKIAKLLKKELEEKGFKVYLTRHSDIFLTLKERVELGKRYKADLFVSIHANANRAKEVSGVEVYYLSEKYVGNNLRSLGLTDEVLEDLDSLEYRSKFYQKFICGDNSKQSLDLANSIVSTMEEMGFKVKGPMGAPFYVLKYAYIPTVLVEIGYLTNPYEEKLLKRSYYLEQIAQAVAIGVDTLNRRYVRLYGER